HRLVPRDATEAADHGLLVQQLPEFLRAEARERVLDVHGAAQLRDVGGGVGTLNAAPPRVRVPFSVEAVLLRGSIGHCGPRSSCVLTLAASWGQRVECLS